MKPVTRTVLLIIILLSCVSLSSAWAEMESARIMLGTREAALAPSPVYDGKHVFAPLHILSLLSVSYTTVAGGDKVIIIAAGGQTGDIGTIDINGTPMVAMDKVVELIGAETSWDETSRTLTLIAHLESVEFVDNTLKVNCSIPVVYKMHMYADKLYVDIASTKLASAAKEVYVGSSLVARARLGQIDQTTARVVLDLEKKVGYKISSRMPASQILMTVGENLPIPASEPQAKPQSSPQKGQPFTIQQIRVDTVDDNQFNIVMATSGPGSATSDYGVNPPQIVVNLNGGTLAESAKIVEGSHPLLRDMRVTPNSKKVRIELNLTRLMTFSVLVEPASTTISVYTPKNSGGMLADKFVIIDPGHGGSQKGACIGSIHEKNVNLTIAKELAEALQQEGSRVLLTRSDDRAMGLAVRPEVAIDNNADFFISIHCNSCDVLDSANGIETFYFLKELSSTALAYAVQSGVCTYTGMKDRKAQPTSGLAVLRRLKDTGIPGILLECGFLNHSSDRKKLLSADYRSKLVSGVIAGFKAYVEGSPINKEAIE